MALVSGSSSVNRPTASVSSPRIISIIPKLSRSTGPAKLRTPGMKWIGNGAISGKVCVRIASCRSPTDAGAGTSIQSGEVVVTAHVNCLYSAQ